MSERLSPEEFNRLFRKYKKGDRDALAKLLAANQGLIGFVARRYIGLINNARACGGVVSPIDWEELYQAGNIGLMRALETFDPNRGASFCTYALCLYGGHLERAVRDYIMDCFTIRGARYSFQTVVPLDKHHGLVGKMVRRGRSAGESSVDRDLVEKFLGLLTKRERQIVCLRFGIMSDGEKTLQEVADKFKMSRERVRQIIVGAFRKLEGAVRHYEETGKVAI